MNLRNKAYIQINTNGRCDNKLSFSLATFRGTGVCLWSDHLIGAGHPTQGLKHSFALVGDHLMATPSSAIE
jgi:hypothetical protein